MSKEDIIVFSSDDWGWKTSKYQLSIRFAKSHRVLFVSSIGFRSPKVSLGDANRIFSKLTAFFRGLDKKADDLFVLTPIIIPFSWIPFRQVFNRWILHWQLRSAKRKLGISSPYIFVFSQNWYNYVHNLQRKKLIYYCVDEHSGFKGISQKEFEETDRKLNRIADLIFCSAKTLYDKNISSNPNTHYMPHGVDYDNFSRALDENTPIADDIRNLPKPIILFFGHISYDWVDHTLVKFIAEHRPDWSIVLVGRYSMDADEFGGFSNVHILGERNFEELAEYCKGADVGIIPFVDSELTRNCNPLKLPEYLSAGLPVVSTNIPELNRFGDKVILAERDASFVEGIEEVLRSTSVEKSLALSEAMRSETWNNRVEEIIKLIHSN